MYRTIGPTLVRESFAIDNTLHLKSHAANIVLSIDTKID